MSTTNSTAQPITSGAPLRKNVPVVTVGSFYEAHAEKLQLKLEGPRLGFHRKIREPTINRPGLALSGFYNYFAEKRVQVLGAAEHSYLDSLSPRVRAQRFRSVFDQQFQFMAILAPDGRVLEANQTCFKGTDIRREQVLGQLFWETPWWDGFPLVQEQWKSLIAQAAQAMDAPAHEADLMA